MERQRRDSIDVVLLAGAALVLGGVATVAPCEVAVVVAVTMAIAIKARKAAAGPLVAVAIALAAGAVRAGSEVAAHEKRRAQADAAIPGARRCSARGTVTSSPVKVRDVVRWTVRLDGARCDGAESVWSGQATLYGGPDDLAHGDEVEVVAALAPPQRFWNEATGDPRPGDARRGAVRSGGALDVVIARRGSGIAAWIDRVRARVRRRIEATFPADVSPMARALVLGESDLPWDDDRSFRASGLSHLLAVSGMHLVLVLAVAVRALHALLARVEPIAGRVDAGRVAAAIGIPVAWAYAQAAGAGGSTVRAAWMATVVLTARALGRRTDPVRAFAWSLVAMAAVDPLVAFDLSFVLSAGATAGLLAWARPWGDALASRLPSFAAPVARAAATTAAASLPCVPIVARFAPTVPLGGVLANLVAVPVGECVALPVCLAHALLGWWPAAERGCAVVASGALVVVRAVARGFAVPALTTEVPQPTSWQFAVAAVAVAALGIRASRSRAALASIAALALALLVVLEIGARRAGGPRGVLRATFLDVGQGDAAVVDLPDGEAIVIDGGGLVGSPIDVGERVVAPELRARRRRSVAFAVLTHPHPDHFGGLGSGLAAARVDSLWDTGQGEREGASGAYAALLAGARAHGTRVLRPDSLCGARLVGGARVEVLAPCPAPSPDRGPNDNSFVLRLSFGARSILFVGDAEREQEADLLARARESLRADVLKVGHHGSRTSSSPAFVAAVAPREAVVSAGARNRFGHPSAQTLSTLAAAGARVWRTDRDGSVIVTTDGESLDVRSLAR